MRAPGLHLHGAERRTIREILQRALQAGRKQDGAALRLPPPRLPLNGGASRRRGSAVELFPAGVRVDDLSLDLLRARERETYRVGAFLVELGTGYPLVQPPPLLFERVDPRG